jgi:hypothetical protein
VDDASGGVVVRFAKEEDTLSMLDFWKRYLQRNGIPAEVYTDGASVYFDPKKPKRLTQFGPGVGNLREENWLCCEEKKRLHRNIKECIP